jgi:hypothetical protein
VLSWEETDHVICVLWGPMPHHLEIFYHLAAYSAMQVFMDLYLVPKIFLHVLHALLVLTVQSWVETSLVICALLEHTTLDFKAILV